MPLNINQAIFSNLKKKKLGPNLIWKMYDIKNYSINIFFFSIWPIKIEVHLWHAQIYELQWLKPSHTQEKQCSTLRPHRFFAMTLIFFNIFIIFKWLDYIKRMTWNPWNFYFTNLGKMEPHLFSLVSKAFVFIMGMIGDGPTCTKFHPCQQLHASTEGRCRCCIGSRNKQNNLLIHHGFIKMQSLVSIHSN